VTINGAGARATTLNANGASRVLVVATAGGAVTLTGVTVTGGSAPAGAPGSPGNGGGIFVGTAATFTLRESAVVGNSAAITGGGISFAHSGGSGVVEDSLIAGNQAGSDAAVVSVQGGGIFAQNGLRVVNSTITDNTAQTTTAAQGGGIAALVGTADLVNATVSQNTAQGGVSSAGGGVMNASTLNATNTILAGNTGGNCGVGAVGATVANNLSSDATCGFSGPSGRDNTDPQLGTLADYGGPTNTRRPAAASPALNAGTPTGCPTRDQRGVTRPEGTGCDIGAVENAPPSIATGPATNVGTADAVLTAQVRNPLVQAAVAGFQYGRTTAYGRSAQATGVPAQATTATSARVTGLASGAEWHYRPIVVNADGFAIGQDRAFRTLSAGRKPYLKLTGVPRTCRRSAFELRFRTRVSGAGVGLRSVRVTLDRKRLKTVTRAGRFRVKYNPRKLKPGRHALRVYVTDSKGRVTSLKRSFTRCKAEKRTKKKRR
jgi:hypothetical protein